MQQQHLCNCNHLLCIHLNRNSTGKYHLQRSMNCHHTQGYSQELESNNSTISIERNQTKSLSCLIECQEAQKKSRVFSLPFILFTAQRESNAYTSNAYISIPKTTRSEKKKSDFITQKRCYHPRRDTINARPRKIPEWIVLVGETFSVHKRVCRK